MRSIVHGLEAEYWGRIDFVYLDIDDPANQAVRQKYRFTVQPLFVLIAPDGAQVRRLPGYHTADQLREALDQVLASGR